MTEKIGPERWAYWLPPCCETPTYSPFLASEKYAGGTWSQLPAVTKVTPPKSWSVTAGLRSR